MQGTATTAESMAAPELAAVLLAELAPELRQQRKAKLDRLASIFGFQRSSAANQLQHYESLLLSHLSQADGSRESALRSLHRTLLLPFSRWRVQTSGTGMAYATQQGFLQNSDGVRACLPDAWSSATFEARNQRPPPHAPLPRKNSVERKRLVCGVFIMA